MKIFYFEMSLAMRKTWLIAVKEKQVTLKGLKKGLKGIKNDLK